MTAHRAALLLAGGILWMSAVPASAQVPDQVLLNILRECAKIDDLSARLACYDNNIRSSPGAPAPTGPVSTPAPSSPAATAARPGSGGFGAEDIRRPDRFSGNGQAQELRTRVQSAQLREPGVYLITLEDGAQWLFTESTPNYYRAPKPGDMIEINRGAMNSFLFRFDGQPPVRIQRIG